MCILDQSLTPVLILGAVKVLLCTIIYNVMGQKRTYQIVRHMVCFNITVDTTKMLALHVKVTMYSFSYVLYYLFELILGGR